MSGRVHKTDRSLPQYIPQLLILIMANIEQQKNTSQFNNALFAKCFSTFHSGLPLGERSKITVFFLTFPRIPTSSIIPGGDSSRLFLPAIRLWPESLEVFHIFLSFLLLLSTGFFFSYPFFTPPNRNVNGLFKKCYGAFYDRFLTRLNPLASIHPSYAKEERW